MYHPWRHLRTLTDLVVVWLCPAKDAPAATDGERVVWLDPRLLQVERRCVLAHELVHVERGHRGCQPAAVEVEVRREAAARLVPFESLFESWRWSLSFSELAAELWVTESVLADRFRWLTKDEWAQILAAAGECPA
jgi:hypothetical protein